MVPFQKITEACKNTGLSQYYLRQGCKNGTVPHIRSGGVYYVNVPALMEELDKKKIVLVAGFQGINHYGDITTLGRGGERRCYAWTRKQQISCGRNIPTMCR